MENRECFYPQHSLVKNEPVNSQFCTSAQSQIAYILNQVIDDIFQDSGFIQSVEQEIVATRRQSSLFKRDEQRGSTPTFINGQTSINGEMSINIEDALSEKADSTLERVEILENKRKSKRKSW